MGSIPTGVLSTAFRPPIWSQINTTSILVPVTPSSGQSFATDGSVQPTLYVFDAVPLLEHTQEIVKTSHPVQTGANITDHSYVLPAKVVLEVRMSDALDSFTSGLWSGAGSKSVSAYQTLLAIQQSRVPIQVTTRLRTYTNMLITSLFSPDTHDTRYGLKGLVTFEEILTASVTVSSSISFVTSERPQTTNTNNTGSIQNTVPSNSLINQYNVLGSSAISSYQNGLVPSNLSSILALAYPYVPGAGNWSSNPIASLPVFP